MVLDDDFLELSFQRKIFSQRILTDIMKYDSPPLEYCMKQLFRGQTTHLHNLLAY
jgi:hypothetical protein